MRKKIRDKVDEVHKQLCKFLVSNFDYRLILLPPFETSEMVESIRERYHPEQPDKC